VPITGHCGADNWYMSIIGHIH